MPTPAKPAQVAGDRSGHVPAPSREDVAALRLIAEQVAIPLDQLARFLCLDRNRAAELVTRLRVAGLLHRRRFLARDPSWAWLTRSGAAASGTGFASIPTPSLRLLTHRRAVNEVRLFVQERAPQGHWHCERAVQRGLGPNEPLPDAVFEIGAERHAIEVELSRKSPLALRRVLIAHGNRYDAVLYFCSPQTRGMLDELREQGDWPKLTVRDVPGMQRRLTTRSRGFGLPMRGTPPPPEPRPGTRRRRKRRRPLQPWEQSFLALVSEQGAIPLDQLAAFLDCDEVAIKRLVWHFTGVALAKRAGLLPAQPDWVWLTERGNRFSATGFKAYLPAPGALARLRAINAVRLQVAKQAPQANWIGWRALRSELRGFGQIPNAVVEVGAERHAIEVELTPKKKKQAVRMISHRSANYDAVICFCSPRSRRFYQRLAAEGHWPKLVVKDLPKTGLKVPAGEP